MILAGPDGIISGRATAVRFAYRGSASVRDAPGALTKAVNEVCSRD